MLALILATRFWLRKNLFMVGLHVSPTARLPVAQIPVPVYINTYQFGSQIFWRFPIRSYLVDQAWR